MKDKCGDCKFWRSSIQSTKDGICLYYPQTVEKGAFSGCSKWRPREGCLIESNLIDAAQKMLISGDFQDAKDFSDSMTDLVIAISHIDQFMKENPDIEIRFGKDSSTKDSSTGDKVFLGAYILLESYAHKCIYGAAALSFEALLLRISNGIAEMKKDQ